MSALVRTQKALGSALVKRIGLLSVGIAMAQAVTLLTSPVLTRLFTPETFGMFGLFSSLGFVIGNVSTMRYDLGIVMAKTRTMATALYALCVVASLLISLAVGVIMVAGGGKALATVANSPTLADFLPYSPLLILTIGLYLSGSQWATRNRRFGPQAQYQITRAVAVAGLQVAAGYLALGAQGLVWGQTIGFGLAAVWLLCQSVAADWPYIKRGFSLRRMRLAAIRFRRLPFFTAPQDFLTSLSQNLPHFILAALFGTTVVGYYWLAIRAMQMPINFISQSVRQVYLQHLTLLYHQKKALFLPVTKATVSLSLVGTVIFLPIVVWGPSLFSMAFGQDWVEGGSYARWVAIWMLSVLVKVPAWCVFHTLGLQRTQFLIEAALFAAQNSALVIVAFVGGPLNAVAAYTLTCFAFNLAYIARGLWYSLRSDRERP